MATWAEQVEQHAAEVWGDVPPPLTDGQRAALRAAMQPAVRVLAERLEDGEVAA